ncbi:MAG: alpha/beta hydrolase-fold protein [Candidatus Sericytochromatia bacterium]
MNNYKTKKLSLKNKVFQLKRNYLRGSIIRHHLGSSNLNNSRDIDIYLPPSYNKDRNKHYPVLYMHDGNNLFYPEIAFAGKPWKINKTVDMLINTGLIQEIIVVGIHNTIGRNYEYTWDQMKYRNGFVEGGGGYKYSKFIINEVKDYIDRELRTLPDRNNTAIAGSSLGGLISYYLALYYPNIFGKTAIISPSLWWSHGKPLLDSRAISNNLKIWLDMGTQEGHSNIEMTRFMRNELYKKGYREGYNLGYLEDRGGKHNEVSWGNRFHLPLIFFFGTRHSLIFSKV